ncbi:uncharacterized protein LOC114922977 [Protobothrops mucrosquamatus]|uniref:uncharacterized protein LOC114922977 n=1 Tax=Protobothrops mucrosquamatus TaxID=103944 RepID=UPI0010FB392B|nr:uncharacterized protein LOC114922977 [Protobothrops mucrosquamatus]
MDSCIGTLEIVICAILIACSVIGNPLLVYFTKRCINDKSRIPLILIVNLALIHLIYNLVVNVLKIVYASGIALDSDRCKLLAFFTNFTTSLAIWFTLYLIVFYTFKLCRVVHPPTEATTTECWKCHLFIVGILWVAGFAFCCPFSLYTGKNDEGYTKNESTGSFIYTKCKTEYKNYQVEFFYGKLFLVAIDLLPLLTMLLVGFRIMHLLCEYKKATYGCIWVGRDASETEVLRACKFLLLLIPVIISLWISNFILIRYLKNFKFKYFAPPVLTVLSSGYSAVSPYFLMLINYKVIVKVKCFCYKAEKKTVSLSTVSSSINVSPYA